MSEMFWFDKSREKQKLMSEAVEIARTLIETLKKTNFEVGRDIQRVTKKAFTPFEFSPKNEDEKKPLLTENEIVEALGVDPDAKFEDAPLKTDFEGGVTKQGLWPTIVPDLYYVTADNEYHMGGYGYFIIIENLQLSDPKTDINKKISDSDLETMAEWNKRVWGSSNADKKANKELDDEFGPTP